jgi:hypothetical protein
MDTDLNLHDLSMMVKIIDACTERGSFKGNELLVIGTLREKLSAVLNVSNETFEEQSEFQIETAKE